MSPPPVSSLKAIGPPHQKTGGGVLSKNRVIVAMSGGVDSSLAAFLLKRGGFEVLGLSMELYSCDRPLASGCCTPKDRLDARKVCELLAIPFEILDLRVPFRQQVLAYFAKEYGKGRTPIPCAPCNSEVRFNALLEYANAKQANWIATGHYARVLENGDGSSLLRAKDLKKDQSYFLWGLSPEIVGRLKLPLGDLSKEKVRQLAREALLPTSEKQESQDLCFVGPEDHARFIEEHFPQAAFPAGDFVDKEGHVLGRHRGLHAYTIGQRRGLGVSLGRRSYVARLVPEKNQVMLGSKESLRAKGLIAKDVHWLSDRFMVYGLWSMVCKIRSTHPGVSANIEKQEDGLKVTFASPQEAVTPGQAAVFYDGEHLLGGAWIERAFS